MSATPIHPALNEKLTSDELKKLSIEFRKYISYSASGKAEFALDFLTEGRSPYMQYNGYVSLFFYLVVGEGEGSK